MNPSPQRILVIRRRYLGDLVLLDPVLRALRARYPEAFLALLVDEGNGGVLAGHPALDRILEIPLQRQGEGRLAFAARYWRAGRELRALRFDTSINYQPQFRVSGLVALAGIPRRVGFAVHKDYLFARTNVRVATPERFFQDNHVVGINHGMLAPFGVEPPADCRIAVPAEAQAEVDTLLATLLPVPPRPLVVVHPGGRVACRRWPAAAFAEAIAVLKAEGKTEIVLTGGPGEEALLKQIAAFVPGGVPVVPPLPLDRFAALCHRAAVYLGNDTGSMHVAAAAGTRVVGLFGSQLIPVWRPYGAHHIALQSPRPCPCPTPRECEPGNSYRNRCVSLIPVEEVIAAVHRCLEPIPA